MDVLRSGENVMADIWSLIGVILGIILMILLVSSKQANDERQDSVGAVRYSNEEDDLLDEHEELILIEDFEEELEDAEYFDDEG